MTGHQIGYQTIATAAGGEVAPLASCTCGQASGRFVHRWQSEDWGQAHLDTVRRARAALSRTPSLRNVGLHYRKMADNPDCTDEERAQWALLAEEVEARVLRQQPLSDDDQLPLF